MRGLLLALVLANLAGCAQLEQSAAQGSTSPGYPRQFNNGFPYPARLVT